MQIQAIVILVFTFLRKSSNEGDEFSDEILSPSEEFGSFEAEGLIYYFDGEDWDEEREQYTSWQITKVTPTDPYCDEGDTADFY